MSDRLSLFYKEAILFVTTITVGLLVAYRYSLSELSSLFEPIEATFTDLLVFVAVFLVFTILLIKYIRVGNYALRFSMTIAVFVGVQFVTAAFFPSPWPFIAGLLFALAPAMSRNRYIRFAGFISRFFPIVLIHNFAIVITVAGIAVLIGLSITPITAAILLTVLSLYDIYAVYKSKHMVRIAERMMASGVVFGFLIPTRWSDVFRRGTKENVIPRVMVLGSGDVGLPLVLIASSVPISMTASIIVSIFSVIGIGVTHWLFTSQRRRVAMAALPPVATSAIIGYLVAVIIGA